MFLSPRLSTPMVVSVSLDLSGDRFKFVHTRVRQRTQLDTSDQKNLHIKLRWFDKCLCSVHQEFIEYRTSPLTLIISANIKTYTHTSIKGLLNYCYTHRR